MSTYSFNVSNDPRERATTINQTVNSTGGVTRVLYTLTDGSTVEDNYTYGANSLNEPVTITRGSLQLPAPGTLILSNFTANTLGNLLSYNSNIGVGSLTGSIFANGVNYNLAHTGNGTATISPFLPKAAVANITITASSPKLLTAVENVTVLNNSIRIPLSWTGVDITSTLDGVVSTSGGDKVGTASNPINSALPFEVRGVLQPSITDSFYNVVLDNDTNSYATWGAGTSSWTIGLLFRNGETWTSIANAPGVGNLVNLGIVNTSPVYYRIKSTVAGTVVLATSNDGVSYVDRRTVTGVTGNQYMRVYSVSAGNHSATVELYV